MSKSNPCEVKGCHLPRLSRFKPHCDRHHRRLRKYGFVGDARVGPDAVLVMTCQGPDCHNLFVQTYVGNRKKDCSESCRRRRLMDEKTEPCRLNECTEVEYLKGLCYLHYERLRRTGSVGPPDRLRGKNGEGWLTPDGYRMVTVDGQGQREHRLVMELELGRSLRDDETVHHINNDPLDNRIENLQLRSGKHGTGAAAHCGDCGSINIEFDELEGE